MNYIRDHFLKEFGCFLLPFLNGKCHTGNLFCTRNRRERMLQNNSFLTKRASLLIWKRLNQDYRTARRWLAGRWSRIRRRCRRPTTGTRTCPTSPRPPWWVKDSTRRRGWTPRSTQRRCSGPRCNGGRVPAISEDLMRPIVVDWVMEVGKDMFVVVLKDTRLK